MSNLKTGLWSAIGAVIGGAVGAAAGKAAIEYRPRVRYRYSADEARGDEIEDAMVIGGAAGAVAGAFIAGAAAGEPETPPPPQLPK
jgi:hypothetical protein